MARFKILRHTRSTYWRVRTPLQGQSPSRSRSQKSTCVHPTCRACRNPLRCPLSSSRPRGISQPFRGRSPGTNSESSAPQRLPAGPSLKEQVLKRLLLKLSWTWCLFRQSISDPPNPAETDTLRTWASRLRHQLWVAISNYRGDQAISYTRKITRCTGKRSSQHLINGSRRDCPVREPPSLMP